MKTLRRMRRGWFPALVVAVLFVGAACSSDSGDGGPRPVGQRPNRNGASPSPSRSPAERDRSRGEVTTAANLPAGYLLASSFDQRVCGRWVRPAPGCEFGVEGGDTTTGPYPSRTGDSAARIQRMTDTHMGIIAERPLPNGHGFIGVAARVPAFPAGAVVGGFGARPNIQLMQLSPTDGRLPAMPVEVRLFTDRSIGIGLFSDKSNTVMADWKVPVDRWFYMVVEVSNGTNAPVRMWLYDSEDRLMDEVSARFNTRQVWRHQGRAAQKVGGSTSTTVPMFTYYDDWYIATRFMGPVHVSSTGEPLPG